MIEPITAQEALNRNWQQFIVEGKPPGANEGLDCRLRIDGRACGVGILIRDEDYDFAMEDLGLGKLGERLPYLPDVTVSVEHEGGYTFMHHFISDLQEAHDDAVGSNFRGEYERNLRNLAARFSLEVPEND